MLMITHEDELHVTSQSTRTMLISNIGGMDPTILYMFYCQVKLFAIGRHGQWLELVLVYA
jgi:hypothetical protein